MQNDFIIPSPAGEASTPDPWLSKIGELCVMAWRWPKKRLAQDFDIARQQHQTQHSRTFQEFILRAAVARFAQCVLTADARSRSPIAKFSVDENGERCVTPYMRFDGKRFSSAPDPWAACFMRLGDTRETSTNAAWGPRIIRCLRSQHALSLARYRWVAEQSNGARPGPLAGRSCPRRADGCWRSRSIQNQAPCA